MRYGMSARRGFFYGARLYVGAVEDGERFVGQFLTEVCLLDGFRHHFPFFALVSGTQKAYAVAYGVVGPNLFLYLLHILSYDGVGGIYDDLGGAVVLFEFEEVQVGVVAAEVEDVLYVGTAEGIDALGIVAHHADVLETGGKLLDDEVLRVVGVLVLVHHDVVETVLVF